MVTVLLQFCILFSFISISSSFVDPDVHCAKRREISPCTCQNMEYYHPRIVIKITCEGVESFQKVITAIEKKFDDNVLINLQIRHSDLEDLPQLSFEILNLTIFKLELNHDNLSLLPETVFYGLGKTEILNLADNAIGEVPRSVLKLMPFIKTLNLDGGKIQKLLEDDFVDLPYLKSLALKDNNISQIDTKTFPSTIIRLQLGGNQIRTLNGSLRHLNDLEWLFIANNKMESLEDELPRAATRFKTLIAMENRFKQLPQIFKHYDALDFVQLDVNQLESLDCALSKSKKLTFLELTDNRLSVMNEKDFEDLEILHTLRMGKNNLKHLNGSILPLKSLRFLNLSHNEFEEFSLLEIRGLNRLEWVDLSHNLIHILAGQNKNLVEATTRVVELKLEYNKLVSLSGALMGLAGLRKLNLSHNFIETILPEDLIGLDDLKILDISYNRLTTLEETSKTVLPKLDELLATHNLIQYLDKDFHGLPSLCRVDLSYNEIASISSNLVDKTQCKMVRLDTQNGYDVNGILRIYLEGNPVLCKPEDIEGIRSKNNTEIYGNPNCPPANNVTVSQLP